MIPLLRSLPSENDMGGRQQEDASALILEYSASGAGQCSR